MSLCTSYLSEYTLSLSRRICVKSLGFTPVFVNLLFVVVEIFEWSTPVPDLTEYSPSFSKYDRPSSLTDLYDHLSTSQRGRALSRKGPLFC